MYVACCPPDRSKDASSLKCQCHSNRESKGVKLISLSRSSSRIVWISRHGDVDLCGLFAAKVDYDAAAELVFGYAIA